MNLTLDSTSTVTSWDDVHTGHEYTPATPLTGWRISVALINGLISPWIDADSTVTALCHAEPEDRHHDGTTVHPSCVCGLYVIDSRRHLIDYWPDASTRLAGARKDIGTYRWGGAVACRVETAGNVTARATRDGMTPPDSEDTYRAAALTLRHVFVPTGCRPNISAAIRRKYPDVTVTDMTGPLHTIAQLPYRWADQ